MKKWDKRRLKEETDIEDVVDALAIPVKIKGSAKFIRCPRPDHDDQHESCYFRDGDNFLYCNSCGKAINPVDLIMYSTGMSFKDAIIYLWEINGKPEWFMEDCDLPKRSRKIFRLSREEADLIGLKMPGRVLQPVRASSLKKPLEKGYQYIADKDLNYITCKPVHCTVDDFMSNKQFALMVKEKAAEKKGVFRDIWESSRVSFPELAESSLTLMIKCDEIIVKAAKFA